MFFFNYFIITRSPIYSFIFTLPLFVIYEIGLFLISSKDLIMMRNGADALLRQILEPLGNFAFYWIGFGFFIGFFITYYMKKDKWSFLILKGNFLVFMAVESLFFAFFLFSFMSNIKILLMSNTGSILIQQVTLAIGAGIYEEILFRVLLIYCLVNILEFIFEWSKLSKYTSALMISSAIFSLFHFIGEFGDYYSFDIFMYRFLAGIFLGLLYLFRGVGIAAWTHAIYDIIVITKITIK